MEDAQAVITRYTSNRKAVSKAASEDIELLHDLFKVVKNQMSQLLNDGMRSNYANFAVSVENFERTLSRFLEPLPEKDLLRHALEQLLEGVQDVMDRFPSFREKTGVSTRERLQEQLTPLLTKFSHKLKQILNAEKHTLETTLI